MIDWEEFEQLLAPHGMDLDTAFFMLMADRLFYLDDQLDPMKKLVEDLAAQYNEQLLPFINQQVN